jgi:hypothetical protein
MPCGTVPFKGCAELLATTVTVENPPAGLGTWPLEPR